MILFSWAPNSPWKVTAAMKFKIKKKNKQKHLFLGRKGVTNLDSIFRSRDITLLTEVQIVKAMLFPVVMYVDVRVGP